MPDSPRGPSETLRPRWKGRRHGGGFRFPGLSIGRTSPHEASKPGHTHLTDVAADEAREAQRAQAWGKATGRPIPPWLRARTTPVRQATRRSSSWREDQYGGPLTPAQYRRLTRKAGMTPQQRAPYRRQLEQPPVPRRPRTPAQLRRAAKNAAQQARHLARVRE